MYLYIKMYIYLQIVWNTTKKPRKFYIELGYLQLVCVSKVVEVWKNNKLMKYKMSKVGPLDLSYIETSVFRIKMQFVFNI